MTPLCAKTRSSIAKGCVFSTVRPPVVSETDVRDERGGADVVRLPGEGRVGVGGQPVQQRFTAAHDDDRMGVRVRFDPEAFSDLPREDCVERILPVSKRIRCSSHGLPSVPDLRSRTSGTRQSRTSNASFQTTPRTGTSLPRRLRPTRSARSIPTTAQRFLFPSPWADLRLSRRRSHGKSMACHISARARGPEPSPGTQVMRSEPKTEERVAVPPNSDTRWVEWGRE